MDGSGELVPFSPYPSSTLPVPSAQPSPSSTVSLDGLHQTWGTLAITVGSVCVAMAVLLLVLIGIVVWRLVKKHRQRDLKKQCMSESPERYHIVIT